MIVCSACGATNRVPGAPWCGPCHMIAPIIDQLAAAKAHALYRQSAPLGT